MYENHLTQFTWDPNKKLIGIFIRPMNSNDIACPVLRWSYPENMTFLMQIPFFFWNINIENLQTLANRSLKCFALISVWFVCNLEINTLVDIFLHNNVHSNGCCLQSKQTTKWKYTYKIAHFYIRLYRNVVYNEKSVCIILKIILI